VLAVLHTPWFRVPALAVLVVTLQTVVVSQIHLFGASADVVVLCAVAGGLVGGPQRGTVNGFVFGIVYDLALTTPFGLWPLVLCVAGFLVGLTRNEAIRDNRWLQTGIVFVASVTVMVAYAAVATVFGSEAILTVRLVWTALVVGGVNAALTRPALKVMRLTLLAGDRRPV
jgi:rod shape-determining protein MreD